MVDHEANGGIPDFFLFLHQLKPYNHTLSGETTVSLCLQLRFFNHDEQCAHTHITHYWRTPPTLSHRGTPHTLTHNTTRNTSYFTHTHTHEEHLTHFTHTHTLPAAADLHQHYNTVIHTHTQMTHYWLLPIQVHTHSQTILRGTPHTNTTLNQKGHLYGKIRTQKITTPQRHFFKHIHTQNE